MEDKKTNEDIIDSLDDKPKEKKFSINPSEIIEKSKEITNKTSEVLKSGQDDSKDFTDKEKAEGKALSILSYVSFLAVISYYFGKDNKYFEYHKEQGINLFILEVIGFVAIISLKIFVGWLAPFLTNLMTACIAIFFIILSCVGIVNVVSGKAKELPIIGKIKFIKKDTK